MNSGCVVTTKASSRNLSSSRFIKKSTELLAGREAPAL